MTKRLTALVAILALAACATVQDNRRTAIGAGTGAAAGAALGTLVGGNDRRNALVGAGIGLLAGGAVGQYLDRQERMLREDLAGTGAIVEREGDAIQVTLPEAITFATDSASIDPAFRGVLADMGRSLNRDPRSYVDVIGHTDSTGSAAYNRELSERRARSVAGALMRQGVSEGRIATYGAGQDDPVATNATPEGRAENRRVEIQIVPATG